MDYTPTLTLSDIDTDHIEDTNRPPVESLSQYAIIEQVGKGAQGTVYKARRLWDGKIVALKVLSIMPETPEYNAAIKEMEILEQISKPECNLFLSCYYGHGFDNQNGKLLVEMEYIDGPTMDDYTIKLYNTDKEKLYRHLLLITKDLTNGLSYVHNRGLLHNDVKPQNIIISLRW